ncbi:transposase [uncultured Desulfovibrio sp.]|uniref:transposase n=1 Tax=uncultured Desulfovibrio sp. TaxID=167968 RepID=UPI00280532C9|nr:transposase [uncultured Desulfovibrio sp.]
MKRSRFSEEQILGILRQAGVRVVDLCRRNGISDAKRLRQLEEENARLKKMVAEQALDISILKNVLLKSFWSPRHAGKPCGMFRRHTASPSGGLA